MLLLLAVLFLQSAPFPWILCCMYICTAMFSMCCAFSCFVMRSTRDIPSCHSVWLSPLQRGDILELLHIADMHLDVALSSCHSAWSFYLFILNFQQYVHIADMHLDAVLSSCHSACCFYASSSSSWTFNSMCTLLTCIMHAPFSLSPLTPFHFKYSCIQSVEFEYTHPFPSDPL